MVLESRIIDSIEFLWGQMERVKNEFYKAVEFHSNQPEELKDYFELGAKREDDMLKYQDSDNVIKLFFGSGENPLSFDRKLFCGPKVWDYYMASIVFHVRLGVLISQSFSTQSYVDWTDDEVLRKELGDVVPKEILRRASDHRTGGPKLIADHLAYQFLRESAYVMCSPSGLYKSYPKEEEEKVIQRARPGFIIDDLVSRSETSDQ